MSLIRRNGVIVAIDGPSGAGKSTVTKLLADRVGYVHIDTGAMFRALAVIVRRAGIDPSDETAVAELCSGVRIGFERHDSSCCRVTADGEDLSGQIRTPEISMLTSTISSQKRVREILLARQQEMGQDGGVILEGRDIGTVVFPDAEVKFFLTASPEERGRRRYLELVARGEEVSLEQTVEDVRQRDFQDSAREHAPLRKAHDAVEVDSTGRTLEEVVAFMEGIVRERAAAAARCAAVGQ